MRRLLLLSLLAAMPSYAAISGTAVQCLSSNIGASTSDTIATGDGWATPTSGNILASFFVLGNAATVTSAHSFCPSGFTLLQSHAGSTNGSASGAACYKVSDGTETTFTVSWTNDSFNGRFGVCELPGTDLDVNNAASYHSGEDVSKAATSSTTHTSGSASNVDAAAVAYAFVGATAAVTWTDHTNSFVEQHDGRLNVSSLVLSSTGSQTTTVTASSSAPGLGFIMVVDGVDVTAPTVSVALAEATTTSTSTSATMTATDASGSYTMYCGTYADGSTPTAANVKAGTGTGFVASTNASDAQNSGVEANYSSGTNLTASTAYDVNCIAEDAAVNQTTVQKIDITTSGAGVDTPTYDAVASASTTASASITASHAIAAGSNRIVVACVNDETVNDVTGITYNGVPMTLGPVVSEGSNTSFMYFMLQSALPASGTFDVVASRTGSNAGILQVVSYDGVRQITPAPTDTITGTNTTTVTSNSMTTAFANSLIVACSAHSGTEAYDVVSGQTERSDQTVGSMRGLFTDKAIASAGTGKTIQAVAAAAQSRMTLASMVLSPSGGATAVVTTPILLRDLFTDTNGVAIASHTPTEDNPGNGWVASGTKGQAPGTIDIQSNKMEVAPNSIAISTINTPNVMVDVTYTADEVAILSPRYVGTDNYIACRFDPPSTVQLFKRVAATETILSTGTQAFTATNDYRVTAAANGSSLACLVAGSVKASAVDSALSTATKAGIGTEGVTGDEIFDGATITQTFSALLSDTSRPADDPLGLFLNENPGTGTFFWPKPTDLPDRTYVAWALYDGGSWYYDPEASYAGADVWGIEAYNSVTNAIESATVSYTTQTGSGTAPDCNACIPNQSWTENVQITPVDLISLAGTKGIPTATCSVSAGSLATGVTLQDCILSGTPSTTTGSPFTATILFTNATGTDTDAFDMTVAAQASSAPSFVAGCWDDDRFKLNVGDVFQPLDLSVCWTGETGFNVTPLPPGITAIGGVISGTASSAGDVQTNVQALNAAGTENRVLNWNIRASDRATTPTSTLNRINRFLRRR